MIQWLRDKSRQKGQGMVELALILCLIAVVALVTLMAMGNQVYLTYQDIQAAVMNPGDPGGSSPYTCADGSTAVLHGHKYHCIGP